MAKAQLDESHIKLQFISKFTGLTAPPGGNPTATYFTKSRNQLQSLSYN